MESDDNIEEKDEKLRVAGVRADGALVVFENFDDVLAGSEVIMHTYRILGASQVEAWKWALAYITERLRMKIVW